MGLDVDGNVSQAQISRPHFTLNRLAYLGNVWWWWCSVVVLHSIRLNQDMFCLTSDYSFPLTLNITTLEISSSSAVTTPPPIQRAARVISESTHVMLIKIKTFDRWGNYPQEYMTSEVSIESWRQPTTKLIILTASSESCPASLFYTVRLAEFRRLKSHQFHT